MKHHQMFLIVSMAIAVLSVICGCATLGSRADRSITEFEYPQVPDDYPFNTPIWLRSETEQTQIPPEHFEEQILLDMVMVKLWSEGNHSFTAAVIENGTFYPIYPEVAYVKWEQGEASDGTIYRYVGSVLTSDENDSDAIMDQLNKGETPAGIRIVDYQSVGMDPYEFLSR